MKIKTLFIFIVLNIFTLLAVTVLYEYISIDDKLEQLQRTVDLALERAVYNSTASEELFTQKRAKMGGTSTYSYGVGEGSFAKTNSVENAIPVWTGSGFERANAYGLTINNVGFPLNQTKRIGWNGSGSAYSSDSVNSYDSVEVFTYLFGQPRGSYMNCSTSAVTINTAMDWANNTRQKDKELMTKTTKDAITTSQSSIITSKNYTDKSTGSAIFDTTTFVRKDFADFYKNVGSKILTGNFVKVKDGEGFRLEYAVYPVLADMGLNVTAYNGVNYSQGATNQKIVQDKLTEVIEPNPMMTDNWGEVIKVGKQYTSVGGVNRSNYFLTPYSLGVTYIPKDVVKETFIANLDTMCRLNKLASGKTVWKDGIDNSNAIATLNSATGCIKDGNGQETSIYVGGGSTALTHTTTADEVIINDGRIEYDLNSIQMKIEYFVVDLWDTNNAALVHTTVGEVAKSYDDLTPTLNELFEKNQEAYKKNNTGYKYYTNTDNKNYKLWTVSASGTPIHKTIDMSIGYEKNQGRTVIAKVTARIKVHIPYDNAIMQWSVRNYTNHGSGKSEHYDIKMYNEQITSASSIRDGASEYESGVWYQTSTYFAVTR